MPGAAEMALEDGDALMALFAAEKPKVVVNLAAQAGVRYPGESGGLHPKQPGGFGHLLEGCRHHGTQNLVMPEQFGVRESKFALS